MTRSWACVVWCLALALPAGGCGGSGAGASSDATPGDADSATSDSSDGTGSGDTGSRTGAADGHPGDLGRGGDDDGAADVEAGPPEDVAGDVSDAAATSGSDAGDGQAHADSAQGRGTDVAPDIEEPPPGCVVHADCDDSNVCTEDTCIPDGTGGKKCAHATLACSTPDACLGALCDPVAGCASTLVTSDACCFLGVVAEHDFEGAPGAETTEVLANEGAPPAIWHPSAARAFTGSTSYLFAIPGQGSYDNGNLVAGRLTLPTVELPKNIRTRLRFHVWADVEAGDVWDVLLVHVSDPLAGIDELPMPVWSKNYDNISLGEWTTVDVDLGAFEGRSVNVAFTFNSTDHTFNDTEGVYLDAIWLLAGCDDLTCGDAGDCEDGLPCTAETCDGGWCHYDTSGACCGLDADCFDGDACTVDLCVDFSCDNPPVADADCCNTSDDCDDGNGCTADICQPGAQYKCQHPVIAAAGCCEKTSDCNDQDTCTIDSCEDANCQHINTCCFSDAECDDGDDVCTVDSCVAGACQFAFTGVEGCCETEPWGETFELGADGWSFAGGGGGCQWQVNSGAQAASPPGALW